MIVDLVAELTILPPERPAENSAISGKTIVFTGTLTRMSRAEAKAKAESLGASYRVLFQQTDFLVAGADAGSKARKAADSGITVLDEEAIRRWLAIHSALPKSPCQYCVKLRSGRQATSNHDLAIAMMRVQLFVNRGDDSGQSNLSASIKQRFINQTAIKLAKG